MSDTIDSNGLISDLISMAEQLLASGQSPDTVDKLEKYALTFNKWYESYQESVQHNNPANTKKELEELLVKHEKVMEFSENLKNAIPEEMTKLRQKGKGIMAYTDTLPKKISFTKTRKG